MLRETLQARLRALELPAIKTHPCANPQCQSRTRPWHGYVGVGRQFYFGNSWCCSPECFQAAAWHSICRVIAEPRRARSRGHRLPLGLSLLSQGLVDHEALRDALELQRVHKHGRIGDWLQKLGAVSEQQVTEAVAGQWNCAVYPLRADGLDSEMAGLIPYPALKSLRMLPVHHNLHTRTLHIAFSDVVDYSALHTVEQMLDVKTVACIAQESEINSALQRFDGHSRPLQHIAPAGCETREMARLCRDHFLQADGKDAKVLRCGPYIWVRILAKESVDLLFRNQWIPRA